MCATFVVQPDQVLMAFESMSSRTMGKQRNSRCIHAVFAEKNSSTATVCTGILRNAKPNVTLKKNCEKVDVSFGENGFLTLDVHVDSLISIVYYFHQTLTFLYFSYFSY